MDKIKGTGVALITPFNEDLSIDYLGLENLLNHVILRGVDYLVLMGTTAESAVLSKIEREEVIEFCKRINNSRLPIVLGLGGNNTLALTEEIRTINFKGIDAILSVSPAYNKPTQEGIYQHYKMISQSCKLPIILYNVPARTATNIMAETTLRLANDFNNIVAIKEASGDLDQIMKIIKNKPSGFMVISGDDSLTLPMIHMGAEGVISVLGQSHPEKYSQMVELALNGEKEKSNALHYNLYDFYEPLYSEGNPAGIKACLEIMGVCKSFVRPPLVKASDTIRNRLEILLRV